MSFTLGIHDGHTATASVAKDGKIVASISEERLNREKEWIGFPTQSIQACLQIAGIGPDQIEGVGIVGLMEPTGTSAFHRPPALKRLFGIGTHVLPESFLESDAWVRPAMDVAGHFRKKGAIAAELKALDILASPTYYEHHVLHAATAHLTAQQGTKENLVITCDGSGDGVCATVSIGRGNGLERLATVSNYNSIGEFYTRITQYLGMKPMSHEYKVMGLAPYAREDSARRTYDVMKDWYAATDEKPLVFKNRSGAWKWDLLRKMRRELAGHRFDHIAWAAQAMVENLLVRWIRGCVKKTGIDSVVLSGGVFMNVKANHAILSLPEIRELFVLPSAGDESLAMGAALVRGIELGQDKVHALREIYFGPEFGEEHIEPVLRKASKKFHVEKIGKSIHKHLGSELADGKIIARMFGRMEWGARALGNRSILADPRNPDALMKINEAIKMRDFWMPFAPSMLDTRADDYLVNPTGFHAPYMAMAFPTRPDAKNQIRAALHPYDFTARPQVLEKSWNPEYYEVISAFEQQTGVGALLNTSLNLHGDPIVCTPQDALYTLENSALDGLALGEYLILRR